MFFLLNELSNDDVVLLVDSAFFKGKVLRDFLIARNILTKLHMVNAMRTIFSPVLFWIANYTMNVAMYPAQNKSANINSLSFISLVRWVIGWRIIIFSVTVVLWNFFVVVNSLWQSICRQGDKQAGQQRQLRSVPTEKTVWKIPLKLKNSLLVELKIIASWS